MPTRLRSADAYFILGVREESGIVHMRNSNWTPSIVPVTDQDVCLVVDDLGRLGLIYCESDVEASDVESVINALAEGQYSSPASLPSMSPKAGRWIYRRK